MKLNIAITILLIIFSTSSIGQLKISSKDAPYYLGKEIIACGELVQVSEFKKGVYLNMNNEYPKQSMTFVVWQDKIPSFEKKHGSLKKLKGKSICGKGTVTEYKNNIQIELENNFSLQVNDD